MKIYPSRIVCLTEETTETLYLLGEGDRVVGVSVDAAEVARRDPEIIFSSWCGKKMKKATIVGPASLTDGMRQLHECLREAQQT